MPVPLWGTEHPNQRHKEPIRLLHLPLILNLEYHKSRKSTQHLTIWIDLWMSHLKILDSEVPNKFSNNIWVLLLHKFPHSHSANWLLWIKVNCFTIQYSSLLITKYQWTLIILMPYLLAKCIHTMISWSKRNRNCNIN